MSEWLTPSVTYQALLVVQALHLLHHRLAKRHISFAETISGTTLCFPPAAFPAVPGPLFMAMHAILIGVQAVGSLWIRKLTPTWAATE